MIKTLNDLHEITVPACGPGWANVKVAFQGATKQHRWGCGSVQRKIDLKTFKLAAGELDKTHLGAMPFEDYWSTILAYKQEILELCEVLNAKKRPNLFCVQR